MLELAASLLGGLNFGNQFSDTKRFPLNLEQGTILDLLNATVRAHGDLVWQFEPNVTPQGLPYMLSFISGHSGYGQGVTLRPAARDLDMTRFEAVPADETGNPVPLLSRIIGLRPDGMPLTLHGPYSSSIRDLATATTTLFGFESAPRVDTPKLAEIAVSGRSLGEVLNALMAVDDRYEWREMNGVIVVRPRTAWSDADSPLFRLVPGFRIDDVTVGDVVAKAAVSLGGGPEELVTFPDSLRMSVEVPAGTVLELLNAIVRSHGQLSWSYEPAPPDDAKRTGLAHVLSFTVIDGSGTGFLVR